MTERSSVVAEWDDWSILSSFLPKGWQQKARECGALRRARGIAGPDALLRILLIHIANGCSLAETSVRAEQLGLGRLNPSAVYKRLRSAEEWLRWMAEQMRASLGVTAPKLEQRVRAVDATAITEPVTPSAINGPRVAAAVAPAAAASLMPVRMSSRR